MKFGFIFGRAVSDKIVEIVDHDDGPTPVSGELKLHIHLQFIHMTFFFEMLEKQKHQNIQSL